MKNKIIKEFRKLKPSKDCKSRTRPYVKFICGVCGKEAEIALRNYSETKPCLECQKHQRGEKNFFKKAKEKYGDLFDLSEVHYVDSKTKIKVRCRKHDYSYYINPLVFIGKSYPNQPHKGGCKYCAIESQKQSLHKPIEYYISILNNKFPYFTVLNHGQAKSNLEKIELNCPLHGSFITSLAKIISTNPDIGYLCPMCAHEQLSFYARYHRTDVKGYVYFLYLQDLNLYKLGVTYRSIKRRMIEIGHNCKLLWYITLNTLADAYFIETHLFRKYHKYRVKAEESFGGYSELLSIKFHKPSERLIEAILCLKELNSEELLTDNAEDNSERSLETETCNDYLCNESTSQADGDGNSSLPETEVDIV